MSVSVTKIQQQNNFNPTRWAIAGALGGYIAKDLLPITKAEKEHYQFDEFVIDRKRSVREAVAEELEAIRKIVANGTQDKGYDAYLKYVSIGKNNEAREGFMKELETLPENAQATFTRLRTMVDQKVRDVKKSHNFIFEAAIKRYRPLLRYVFIGALLATGAAFVKYVLSKMASPQ